MAGSRADMWTRCVWGRIFPRCVPAESVIIMTLIVGVWQRTCLAGRRPAGGADGQ